jgi:L,D-transpeptidase catalytic domain
VRIDACSVAWPSLYRSGGAVIACVSLLFAPSVSAHDSAITTKDAPAGTVVATLSNLRTLSRWAYPLGAAAVHQHPWTRSRVVDHLHLLTVDGQAEVYLALRSDTIGRVTWILTPTAGRPNGAVGWVPASALGELHVTRDYLRVNREALRATLYRDGRPIWRAPVGVGRPSLPTPAGHFYITEKLTAIGGELYGPYALGTSAYAPTLSDWPGGGIIGIHGTDEPQLIPGHPSHGCIRLRNSDVARLWQEIQVGTPVEIV